MDAAIDLKAYTGTDDFFGAPWIDVDEWREAPSPHRHVHGGFEGTDTRFTFYFPPAEGYHGRMYQPLEGANAGHEDSFGNEHGNMLGGLPLIVRLGGYMVESNMGHIGDVLDPKAGDDVTIYAFRAAAESGRFSKYVATQVYGQAPHHSYVWGGSGGGRRSPGCLEYCPDVWDGALPFMGGGGVAPKGVLSLPPAGGNNFSSMFNVQRVLDDKIADVVDAVAPGGSGDPFATLDTQQREELTNLYRHGYPRGDEWIISQPTGVAWLWCNIADRLQIDRADYFEAFWTKPGYAGHDEPGLATQVIEQTATVSRVLTAQDFVDDPALQAPMYDRLRPRAVMLAGTRGFDLPIAIEVKDVGPGYRFGMGIKVVSGSAAGRSLYCHYHAGDLMVGEGSGEHSNLRFTGVLPGDEVRLDNRALLAYCYLYRHDISDGPMGDFLRVDGQPMYPQHRASGGGSPFMGIPYCGDYAGKLLWVHHTHDASLWPSAAMSYPQAVLQSQGEEGLAERFRMRWSENAEHVPADFVPDSPGRAASTTLIDYRPIIEQSLADLARWVEDGIEPAGTTFEFGDGKVTLPPTAAERGGIQPVVRVSANGGQRTEVRVGEEVQLEVHAEAPPEGGTIVAAQWDFDGSGTYPFHHDGIDGTSKSVTLTTSHTFDRPGTFFVTALVQSHVDGDVRAEHRRLPNLASARVIVT